MKKQDEIIKGVKGFDKDLKCRGFQYKEGGIYETDKKPVRCTENGFHFCTNPLDVFSYYDPANSRFHEVEGMGQKDDAEEDSKMAVSKIKIGAEISLFQIIKLGVECILKRIDFKNAAATNTGYQSAATVEGKESIACGFGFENKTKASLGSWIVLTEWEAKENGLHIKCLKSAKIDGNKLLADTFYVLKNGKFIIAE